MSGANNKRIRTGLILVLVGFFFLADNLGFSIEVPDWLLTWPLIFVILGLVNVATGSFGTAFIFFSLGGLFYLQYFDYINFRVYWPLFLIVIGLAFLFRDREKKKSPKTTDDYFDEVNIFGGTDRKFSSQKLKGGKITNIFGGSDIDLREAKTVDGAVIEIFTLFGGCDLYLPANWQVNVDTVAIFGGFSDSRKNIDREPTSVVKVKGFTMFGGGEVKN